MKIRLILCSLAAAVSAVVVSGCGSSAPKGAEGVADQVIVLPVPEREPGQTDVLNLVTEPMDTVRVAFVGLGMRGGDAVRRYTYIPGVKIVALCDVYEDRVKASNAYLQERGFPAAQEFYGDTASWRQMVALPDVDLVYICTGWDWHTPIAVQAMKEGKHVAIEVPAAMSIDECWELVNTAEKTRKHCMMLENCVYDNFEMATLNMAQKGLFGEVIHVEGAYLHDLRSMNFALEGEPGHYADMWRLKQNTKRTGDVYPTHGLGPISQILGIHRGDRMKTLVSMNTDEFGMTAYAKEKFGDTSAFARTPYKMGDHTTTLIRTEKGKTMMVQHDVTSPRPYSRIHQVSGTKGFAQKYPMMGIALEAGNEALSNDYQNLSGHSYVSPEVLEKLLADYQHPVIKQVGAQAQEVGGHGGMDFVMDYRLIYCLRNGLPLDMDVYDAAEMSCLTGLSELSIENGSAPVAIPDFTRGAWNRLQGQTYAFTPADAEELGVEVK